MQLYHYYRSSASYRVRIALALKGLAWESIAVHLGNGEHRGANYSALSPSQTVPLLVDGPHHLSQSLAIIEYLDEVHRDPPLLPSDPAARAFVRELALDIACEIHPLNNTRVISYMGALGLSSESRDTWYRHWTESGLQVVEHKLRRDTRGSRFCFGDSPTLADCLLVPQIFNAKRMNCDIASLTKVRAVFDACMELPAFETTQPSAFDPSKT